MSIDYTYNYDNLLTGFTTSGSGVTAPTFKMENVVVDGLGRLKAGTETLTKTNGSTIAHNLVFGYDMLSQLISASISNIGTGSWTADCNYQKNGDMTSRTVQSSQNTFGYVGNQMRTIDGNSLGYDLNGNLTSYTAQATSCAYNWDNKLRSASKGGATINLKYDPMGNRIYKASSIAGNRKYIVDIVGDLPVILMELDATDYTFKKAYIYANAQVLAQYDGSPLTANKYFYLHDRLGSVRKLINQNGAVVVMYTYNPFGETIETDGVFDNAFRFTGQYYDSEIGQYYLRARQYDAYLSRFIGRDPVMGKFEEPMTLHVYLYCINNPINKIDLLGLVYKPKGGPHYDLNATRGIINVAMVWTAKYGPIKAFGPGGNFDYYMRPDFTFRLSSDERELRGSEFGNYLAGYVCYYNWGREGELGVRLTGQYLSVTGHDHPEELESLYWIARGFLGSSNKLLETNKMNLPLLFDTWRFRTEVELIETLADMGGVNLGI